MSEREKPADKIIAHLKTLEDANAIRNKLLTYKPHPCVYVYQTDYKEPSNGFDVQVANEWGNYPSDKLFKLLEDFIGPVLISLGYQSKSNDDPEITWSVERGEEHLSKYEKDDVS